jgi:adenosylmethionine-8-amino-7-oxononanoate aminotransferase
LKTSIQNAGEMQYNFEDLSQEIAGYDKSELREALRLQTEKLAKAEWDKRGEPELNMIKQLIKYLDHKIKTKK